MLKISEGVTICKKYAVEGKAAKPAGKQYRMLMITSAD